MKGASTAIDRIARREGSDGGSPGLSTAAEGAGLGDAGAVAAGADTVVAGDGTPAEASREL